MSSRLDGEQDLDLKGKLRAALVTTGHYTRLDVKVAVERSDSRVNELTDIDVLGVSFDADLKPNVVAGDCTTRARVSPAARVFWLHGVMALFGASRGYLVLTRSVEAHARQAATALGVDLISSDDLDRWLSHLPEPDRSRSKAVQQWLEFEAGLSQLPKGFESLIEYRKYAYWQSEPNQAILQLIRLTASHASLLHARDKWHRALVVDLSVLLSLSLLRACHAIFHTPPSEVPDAVRGYLFGGTRALRQREQLVAKIRELAAASQPRLIDDLSLDPGYLSELQELLVRLLQRPLDARLVPMEIDGILYDYTPEVEGTLRVSTKLAWDVGRFFVKAAGLEAGFSNVFSNRGTAGGTKT